MTPGFLGTRASLLVDVSPWLTATFTVHFSFSIPTFFVWTWLGLRSWRRYSRDLPGAFSRRHMAWGRAVFVGACVTSVTGAAVYVMGFAL